MTPESMRFERNREAALEGTASLARVSRHAQIELGRNPPRLTSWDHRGLFERREPTLGERPRRNLSGLPCLVAPTSGVKTGTTPGFTCVFAMPRSRSAGLTGLPSRARAALKGCATYEHE
jgi:hypothetical protein